MNNDQIHRKKQVSTFVHAHHCSATTDLILNLWHVNAIIFEGSLGQPDPLPNRYAD